MYVAPESYVLLTSPAVSWLVTLTRWCLPRVRIRPACNSDPPVGRTLGQTSACTARESVRSSRCGAAVSGWEFGRRHRWCRGRRRAGNAEPHDQGHDGEKPHRDAPCSQEL